MTLAQRWHRFWSTSYVPRNDLYMTRLKSSAPTVTPAEVDKLARKWAKPQPPVNFDELGVIE